MKKLLIPILLICFLLSAGWAYKSNISRKQETKAVEGQYTLVVEGFDWGPAASKVILSMPDSVSEVNGDVFEVYVKKATACADLSPEEANGELRVLYAYVSDGNANRLPKGKHVTLALYVAPFESVNSPIKYFFNNQNCSGNQWIDFNLTILNKSTMQIWNKEERRILPLVDDFDLSGSFKHKAVTLTYASFTPTEASGQRPLLIWLHGGGEGGTDTTIPLIANRAAHYASPEIQAFFGGAYVLVPQSPSFWMDNGQGQYTRGEVDDMYNESLMALIKDYVDRHPEIDRSRIYLGGCSNGGYMTLKLLLREPDYFAAAFPSALALYAKNLSPADIQRIKDIPMWFIHSKDDNVTPPNETVVPAYHKLMQAGAKQVHFSYFDHVVDITNQFGGEGFHYPGHWSWIYSHANKCQLDFDGQPVRIDGQSVSLMGWLARQRKR
ncbi:MAG: prolyl oligopeptidase family serine peptidase [Bacteroidota bacterium]